MRRTVALAAGLSLWAAPAWAHVVEHAFKDVPPVHWAADAVAEMAVKRSLMRAFADDTFRGEHPFTRAQFAASLIVLVDELESLSKASWRHGPPGKYQLVDVPAAIPERAHIFALVNDYRLWEHVPTISRDHFYPDQTVTRSEVAQVVRNLLAMGEAQGAVLARDPRDPQNRFKDLAPSEWAYQAILGVDQRYRVMIGFPDVTFRPEDELSRFQYAAVGRATFDVIREIVRKTREEKEALAEKLRRDRFQEQRPFYFALAPEFGTTGGVDLALDGRYAAYPDDVFGLGGWFFMAEAQASVGPRGAGALTLGGFPQGPVFGLGDLGDLQLQPYSGVRGGFDSTGALLSPLVFGVVTHWRKGPVGTFALVDWSPFEVARFAGQSWRAGVGADYLLSPKLAVGGGVGLTGLPASTLVAPTVGINLGF